MQHTPVLASASIEYLAIRENGVYVDATFGGGATAHAILERLAGERCSPSMRIRRRRSRRCHNGSVVCVRLDELSQSAAVLDQRGIDPIDGVLFDLGVSTMQFDRSAPRLFDDEDRAARHAHESIRGTQRLRRARERQRARARRHLLCVWRERAARRVARAIVSRRREGTLPKTTSDFAQLVSGVVHRSGHRERIHPATRIFQALRIAVNDELGALHEVSALQSIRCASAGASSRSAFTRWRIAS